MTSLRRGSIGLMLALLVVGVSGCGSDGTVPVTGSVKLADGRPLAGVQLQFYSTEGTVSTGRADESGGFVMKQDAESAGLPPGQYTVVVKPPMPEDIDAPQPRKFHAKYSGRTTTDLSATVSEDAVPLEFVLDPPQ